MVDEAERKARQAPTKVNLVNVGQSPQIVQDVDGNMVTIRPGQSAEIEVQKATADMLKKQAESDRNPGTLQPADMAKKTMKEREAEEADREKQEEQRQKALDEAQKRAADEQAKAQQPKR